MPPQAWKHKRPADHAGPQTEHSIPPTAYIQAYEAQLIYGQHETARELASRAEDLHESSRARGRGLIKWQGDEDADIWADRHDMIHLLSTVPVAGPSNLTARTPSPAGSSSSWDSLPSDTGETFFLSGSEDYEAYEREKKQKWITALREERLREREKEDLAAPSARDKPQSTWPEDEEPPEAILTLMKHTAKSISTSPNPQMLEMRILANHASDERFAFLRGRWPDAWVSVKERLRRVRMNDPERKKKEEKAVGALLGGYDSSDEDTEEDEDEEAVSGTPPPPDEEGPPPPPPSPPSVAPICPDDEAVPAVTATHVDTQNITLQVQPIEAADTGEEEKKRSRRLKAEEWKRKRAEEKACM